VLDEKDYDKIITDIKDSETFNRNIELLCFRIHNKASEVYVDVVFKYPKSGLVWDGAVPIEYKRTGVHANTKEKIIETIQNAYDAMEPNKLEEWVKEQKEFWDKKKGAEVTRSFFEKLKDYKWKCVNCQLPQNVNPSRRIQDIKEFGYTVATYPKKFCEKCNKKTNHTILLRIPRGGMTGYETFSPKLRKKILKALRNWDAYEDREYKSLLPDHKFPETRWDEKTIEDNPEDMSDDEIIRKFQLLTNQRNEQKREVCRRCSQTGFRGTPFGIKFFYAGGEKWDEKIPREGKNAEKGCIGCGWYDLEKWRKELNKKLS
jgi:hypothetical protein